MLGESAARLPVMRPTCLSLLLAEGAPPHVVQLIVGHRAIDVTMTIYAHSTLGGSGRSSVAPATGLVRQG